MSPILHWKHVVCLGGFFKLGHTLLGPLLLWKLKHWVYLSVKFLKNVSGPKNQHQKFYNKEMFPETTTFQSILALWIENEETPLLETCAVRLLEFSIKSSAILRSKIENYNKVRSTCIVTEILWIKLNYDLILSLPARGFT